MTSNHFEAAARWRHQRDAYFRGLLDDPVVPEPLLPDPPNPDIEVEPIHPGGFSGGRPSTPDATVTDTNTDEPSYNGAEAAARAAAQRRAEQEAHDREARLQEIQARDESASVAEAKDNRGLVEQRRREEAEAEARAETEARARAEAGLDDQSSDTDREDHT